MVTLSPLGRSTLTILDIPVPIILVGREGAARALVTARRRDGRCSTAATAIELPRRTRESASPTHGERWSPGVIVMIASPAARGRYGETAWFQLDGRTFISGGITNKIPAKVAMPPAVFRVIAPRPRPKMPTTVR